MVRESHILKKERFPDPVKWEEGQAKKLEVAGKYAQVRIQLCDLADELEKNDAGVVLSVLKQNVPVIHEKIKWLEDNIEISSDYTAHLWEMDEKDAQ